MNLLAFDTETSGVNPETDRIVTAALALIDDQGAILSIWEWLVSPDHFEIPAEATAINGITTQHARDHGQSLDEALGQIMQVLRAEWTSEVPLVAFNAPFDLTLLDAELQRVSDGIVHLEILGPVLDPYVLDKRIVPKRRGTGARRLQNLAGAYGVELSAEDAHGALADAVATARIALKQLQNDLLRGVPLEVIHEAQIAWKCDQAAELSEYFTSIGKNEHVNAAWPVIR